MRSGSLFSGYEGLGMAVNAVFGSETAWVSDIDPGACKILAHRYPDVPNLGDVTKVNWLSVEPVGVLSGGFPCQPVSHAGKRLGDQDERWLWDEFARAIGVLRPRYVVLENVRGLLSAGGGRLFGQVLGDLAAERYDARWVGVRAADVGAPHGRFRVFVVAADAADERHEWAGSARRRGRGLADGGLAAPDAGGERHGRGQDTRGVGRVDRQDAGGARERERAREVAGDRDPAATAAADCGGLGQTLGDLPRRKPDAAWGAYEPAIRRWERVLGRPAPEPTQPGRNGNRQLSPRFVEWMMGLPAGHVTDVPGLTRNQMLKALGNGVVPQQAAAALRWLLADEAGGMVNSATLLPTPTGPAPHDSKDSAGRLRLRRNGYGAELTTIFDPLSGELTTPRFDDPHPIQLPDGAA